MAHQDSSRRKFLKDTVKWAGFAAAAPSLIGSVARAGDRKLHVSCNQYSWTTFYKRDGKDFNETLDSGLADVAASGLDGFEPGVGGLEQIEQMLPLLKKHGLEMRSFYAGVILHEQDEADANMQKVLDTATKAKAFGTKIVVVNPNPIQWGGVEDKTDRQLEFQAKALNKLGSKFKQMGLTLAYHNHDAELRQAAREFHHMMVGTDPEVVKFCLDPNWIYRGAGDSQVAVFDVVKLYGQRVTELHLRQSKNGVWTDFYGPGDIDFPRLADSILDLGVRPHLVLEQAVEDGSLRTMDTLDSFKRSSEYVREVFAGFAM